MASGIGQWLPGYRFPVLVARIAEQAVEGRTGRVENRAAMRANSASRA